MIGFGLAQPRPEFDPRPLGAECRVGGTPMGRKTRRFGLADMLILIAALGAGMYGARELGRMQV